jgi:hypothetical protein
MRTREIPQTAVWGSFKCDLFICISLFRNRYLILHMNRVDLNDPCTAVQGIH